jgi:predicted phage terminase large subunit-like protein
LEIEFNLHTAQLEIFSNEKRFKIIPAGRRFGKTFLSAVTLLVEGLRDKNAFGYELGTERVVYYVAPTFQQGKDIMWKLIQKLGKGVIAHTIDNVGILRLVNGREIHIKGSDRPDTLRGVGLSYVVMDEYASMKPQVWEEIIQPTLSDVRGGAMFIGTPAGKNHFHKLYLEAKKPENEDEWAVFEFKSADNPYLDKKEIESAKRRMSKSAYKQEYEASFSISGGTTLNPELMFMEPEPEGGSFYITVDPSGFEDVTDKDIKSKFSNLDETAIAIVKVGTYGWWVADIIHGRWDVRETSLRILRAAQNYRPLAVGIEKGILKQALMPYIKDQCARLNTYPNIIDVTHGGNKKADRIVWALQGRLEHGRIKFNDKPYLEKLIEQMSDFPNPLAHDDLIDALAYIDQLASVVYNEDIIYDDPESGIFDQVSGY